MEFFPFLNSFIFIIISIIHFYWAFGGKWGIEYAVPSVSGKNEKQLFRPGIIATLIVAFGLLFFALVHLDAVFQLINIIYFKYILIGIAVLFLIRAIGDFKYVGFFKKVKGSKFSEYDSKYYASLCLLLTVNSLITFSFF